MAKAKSEGMATVLGGMSRVAEGLREERAKVVDGLVRTDAVTPLIEASGHVTDGSPCPCGPMVVTTGGFEILPEEPESRPNPPARGKYPKLLQSLLGKGLAPGKPAMSIRVPEGEEPLLVAEGLKREGRRVGQAEGHPGQGQLDRRSLWYVEAWVHPTKDRVVQVLAKEGIAPYTKKPK